MKVTQFKIGNKILYQGGKVTISAISNNSLQFEETAGKWWNPESSSFSPILITAAELIKMGCKRNGPLSKNTSAWEYKKVPFIFDEGDKSITLNLWHQGFCIKALHIFQNILNDIPENISPAW